MGVGGGEVVLELGRPWEGGTTFFWLIHTRLEGGLLVTAFQHGLFLAEPLAYSTTHSYYNIIIINSSLIILFLH